MQRFLLSLCLGIGLSLYIQAQPANNPCSGAITITNLNGTCLTGNDITGATEDIGPSACSAGNNLNVWFAFTAQGVSAEIMVTNTIGPPEITVVEFPTSPCNTADGIDIGCANGTTLTLDNDLVIGTTYYIMVAFTNNAAGMFDICVNNPVPATNDDCMNAIELINLDEACSGYVNNFPSTDVLIPGCFTGSTYNVWFYFEAQGVSLDVHVPSGPGVAQVAVVEFATPCTAAGATVLGCATGTNHIVLDNQLDIGDEYYIVVGFQNSAFGGAGIGLFELCIDNPEPAVNDDCNGAINIPVPVLSDPTTCVTSIAGNPLNNDWPSTDIGTFNCWNAGDSYNIWYSFVAQGPDVEIEVDPTFAEAAQIALLEFTGSPCEFAGAVLLECAYDDILDYNDDLVIGNTYYIAVGFEDNEVGNFCMNVFNPEPPENDEPCDAITLQTDGTCENGTTIYANPEPWNWPAACQSATQNMVWYELSLSDPDNVGFVVDLDLLSGGPGTTVSMFLFEASDCNSLTNPVFFYCGAPPTDPVEWGPIDESANYFLLIGTSEANETDFSLCVDEVPPCFENGACEDAELIPNVLSDQPFVCIPGCNLFADPAPFNNGCEIGNFSTVWYQVPTDPQATLMNIFVTSDEFDAPTITLFQSISGDCSNLQPVGLTQSNLSCITGSNGEAEALGTDVGANEIYYIAVSSLNSVGGNFELCVNTISVASACVVDSDIEIIARTGNGPLTGPFFPGETVSICMNVNSYTASGNGCQWFQGIVPVFGCGWDPASFDADGQPLNATVNGNNMGVAGNGLYGASTWDWFTDVDYHHASPYFQIADLDGNGTVEMCNILFDPDCPNLGGLSAACCGPCWGTTLGDILPGGWFAYGINGTCPTPGPPIAVDWGDGNTCGSGMGPWNFCFDLVVNSYPDCQDCDNLGLGFFTFADGEVGSWTGGPSVCALDQPLGLTLPMCCDELEEAYETLDPICSNQQFVYVIDEPDVDFWQWTVNPGSITGASDGQGGPGTVIVQTLVNNGSSPETVVYTFYGFAGGACPVFYKEVEIEVVPRIMVTLDPQVMCSTPNEPYEIIPNVSGGTGNYEYQWSPGGATTSTLEVANPVNGTQYRVTVTDEAGCFGSATMTITVYTTFPVDINAPVTEQCAQDGMIDLDASASGGMGSYTYEWTYPDDSPASGSSIQTDQSGQHEVLVTDEEGCIGKDSVTIEFFMEPEVSINAVNGVLAICDGQSTELNALAIMGESPYIYSWDTPEGLDDGKNILAFYPGIYTVTVEDANGCTNSAEIEIEDHPEPMPDLGDDHVVCNSDDPIELEVTPQFEEYYWSIGPQANGLQSIEVYQPGTYTVTVTNEFGCTGETSVEIDLFPQPVFNMPDTFSKCAGSSITVDADAAAYGGPWTNWLWPTCGTCFNENTITTPGTYGVYVYDDNNCSGYQEFEVVDNVSLSPNLQGDDVICTGETITLSVDPGFTTYEWSANAGGAMTSSVDVVSAGTYSVTVYDADGCSGEESMTITSGDITASITGPPSICENVTATLTATPAGASYQWSGGLGTMPSVVVDDGTYSVTVTSTDGCTSEASFTIIETPFTPVITGDPMICQTSETTTLDAGGPYANYMWSTIAGNATTQTIVTDSVGTYTVTITDLVGCVGTASYIVAHHPVPFVNITGNPDFCVGGNTTINATPGFAQYEWNTTDNTASLTLNTPGPYSLTITDANGCTNTAAFTVNPPYQETVNITGSLTFCPGDQATLAVPAGYASVLWSTGQTANQINVTTEDAFSVIVVDSDGCIAYDTVMTDENADLNPVISGDTAICDNNMTVLDAGAGFDNYMWAGGLGTDQTVSVNTPGTYIVTVSSNAGCVGADTFYLAGYDSPFAVITPTATACNVQEPGGPTTIVNFNAQITSGDNGGSWVQTGGPGSVNLGNPANVNFAGLSPGTYTFTYTTDSAVKPCAEQDYSMTVTVEDCACPIVDLNNAPDLCNDNGSVTLASLISAQTQTGGTWSIIATPPGSNPGVINGPNFDGSNADPGTYTLQYQVAGLPSYCSDAATVTVNVLPNPTAGIAAAPISYCAGESEVVNLVTLLSGADAGGEWHETSQNMSTGGAFDPNTGTFDVSAQQPGTYLFSYVVMGPGPCPDDMTTVEVVVEANPVADAGETGTLDCITSFIILGGSGSSMGPEFSYSWTTIGGVLGNPNQLDARATRAGTYILTVMNMQTGCTAEDQVVIDQIGDFPTDLDLAVSSPDCEGDPPGSLQVLTVEGGTPPYSYSLNGAPPVSSPNFNNLPAGDYTIQVTDAAGCTLEEEFTIGELVEVDVSIINFVNDTLIYALGDTMNFSFAYSGTNDTPDSLVWYLNDSIVCINCALLELEAYLPGTITLEAYDVRGCKVVDEINFLVVRKRDVYIPNIFSPNGDDLNDFFTLFTDADVTDISLLEIYTRWGDLVFRKEHFVPNVPNQGWDGTFRGEIVNPGVYVYRMEIVYGDGLVDQLAGDITVIR